MRVYILLPVDASYRHRKASPALVYDVAGVARDLQHAGRHPIVGILRWRRCMQPSMAPGTPRRHHPIISPLPPSHHHDPDQRPAPTFSLSLLSPRRRCLPSSTRSPLMSSPTWCDSWRSWRRRRCTRQQLWWKRSNRSGVRRHRRRGGRLQSGSTYSPCTAPDPPGQHLMCLPSNSVCLSARDFYGLASFHDPTSRPTPPLRVIQHLPSVCYTFVDGPLRVLHDHTISGAPSLLCHVEGRILFPRPPVLHYVHPCKLVAHLSMHQQHRRSNTWSMFMKRENSQAIAIATYVAGQQDEECDSFSTHMDMETMLLQILVTLIVDLITVGCFSQVALALIIEDEVLFRNGNWSDE